MPRKFGFCSRFNKFLAKKDGTLYTLYRGTCGQWSCPECSQMLRSKWRSHLALRITELGGVWSFLTVTAPSYGNSKFSTQLNKSHLLFSRKFHLVLQWLRDRYGKIEYVRVYELQRRGAIHAHILINRHFPENELYEIQTGGNKGKKFHIKLKEYLIDTGFGQQSNVENLIGSPLQASVYMTKYITKDTRSYDSWLPKGTRYIQCSRGIGALNERAVKDDEWTVIEPKMIGSLIVRGLEFYDGDKKKRVDYSDLDNGEYEV